MEVEGSSSVISTTPTQGLRRRFTPCLIRWVLATLWTLGCFKTANSENMDVSNANAKLQQKDTIECNKSSIKLERVHE